MAHLPVLEIGGTHVTAAVVDSERWRVVAGSAQRRHLDSSASAERIVAELVAAALALGFVDRSLWGVAIPGPFDYARGVGEFVGVGKFDALRGVDLGTALRSEITDGSGVVHFLNDASAFGIGEWSGGAAFGHRRAIAVTLGTGIGSAFLVDGEPQERGPGIPPDGHLHLVDVGGRPLEESVSRPAIRARYAALAGSGRAPLDVREIAARARAGDVAARDAMVEPLRLLGGVLGPRVMRFGAEVLVVGGSIALAWDVVQDALPAGMDAAAPGWSQTCTLLPAQLAEEAPLIGAARHAWALRTSGSGHA